MAGLDKSTPIPTEIKMHQKSRMLEVSFADGKSFSMSCEFLRVNSPSAEVRGHGPGQETLQIGKKDVSIEAIEPVGNYAVVLRFSDGHDTGIYSWDLLYKLGENQEPLWQDYLDRLAAAGKDRDTPAPPPAPKGGCGSGGSSGGSCGSGGCGSH
ncbi:MAG: DUF971 domain-containing protein [Rhodocyclaceae bacterium]|nr:DUF971 domain-containing protein [Rhodocyclaceae bacterium]